MPRNKTKRLMIVREFRASFQKLTEPVQVIRWGEVLGTWYPEKRVTDRTAVRYPAEQEHIERPERSGPA